MLKRDLEKEIKLSAKMFPVIAILGPRQSGKTTLAQYCFKKYNYVSLEDLDQRKFAHEDPRLFLEKKINKYGIILDEIQFAPDLLSYIKTYVDKSKKQGEIIITGSQNFLLNESISQSLAGRVAIMTLLPLSIKEFKRNKILPKNVESILISGSYPKIADKKVTAEKWYPSYVKTYIERDVRSLKNIGDVTTFQHFLKLCAGRVGQVLNLSSLSNDCGIDVKTAKSWLSILEQCYILFLLQPYYKNFSKRLIKSPKLYFYDSGLLCHLLGVEDEEHLMGHSSRGNIFESFVISEIIKSFYNRDKVPNIYFWRDSAGNEIDCLIEKGQKLIPIEIKAGKTINSSFFDNLQSWCELTKIDPKNSYLVYAGNESQTRSISNIVAWSDLKF
ncbi:MAG: hypothetical protein SZ59_C0005G0032 [candidate division TM6 bacterium GW2011_GWF2_28_16]|nr:MAG: hypothetical protein SZ59_C0005G0032 [candidate division TM6 bacterium GW2011_GWF2_28_16]